MRRRTFPRKNGRPLRRGLRLPRKPAFAATLPTKSGIGVRSKPEQQCADYLSARRIAFVYEPWLLLEGKKFRPDFYLPEFDLFLEISGYHHQPHYRSRLKTKRDIYEKNELRVVFVTYRNRRDLERNINKALDDLAQS